MDDHTAGGIIAGVPFFVTVARRRDCARLRLAGELDLCGVHSLAHAVGRIIAACPPARLVTVDLTDLTFVDVAGGRALIQACQRLDAGHEVAVTRIQPRVQWVLDLVLRADPEPGPALSRGASPAVADSPGGYFAR